MENNCEAACATLKKLCDAPVPYLPSPVPSGLPNPLLPRDTQKHSALAVAVVGTNVKQAGAGRERSREGGSSGQGGSEGEEDGGWDSSCATLK